MYVETWEDFARKKEVCYDKIKMANDNINILLHDVFLKDEMGFFPFKRETSHSPFF